MDQYKNTKLNYKIKTIKNKHILNVKIETNDNNIITDVLCKIMNVVKEK